MLVKTTHKKLFLDLDTNQNYNLTPQPSKKDPHLLFEPTKVQNALSPNTFTAPDEVIDSQKEVTLFWNRVLLTKHSENTLQLLAKPVGMIF